MIIYKIMPTIAQAEKLQQTFGMRFVGLEDPGNIVRDKYQLPDSRGLYPQDIVIDRDGNVAYWTNEFDPQEIDSVLRGLLGPAASIEFHQHSSDPRLDAPVRWWDPTPNPFRESVRLELRGVGIEARRGISNVTDDRYSLIDIYDARGVRVRSLRTEPQRAGGVRAIWDGRDGNGRQLATGIYWVRSGKGSESPGSRVVLIR